MKLTTLEDLICPCCLDRHHTESPLSIASSLPIGMAGAGDMADVQEAILTCKMCECEYPVIAGVLIVVPDVAAYIRKQFGSIISRCSMAGGVTPQMLAYLLGKGYNLAKVESREYYDAPRKLSTYICSHYDGGARLALSNNSLGQYLQSTYQDFYATVLQAWRQVALPLAEKSRAIDVGSYVGGIAYRLADRFERVYGVDDSFAGTLFARQLQIGYPARITAYDLYLEGNSTQRRELAVSLRKNVDFFVASALCLPLRQATFQLTTCFNLLELVSSPQMMVRELRRISTPAADLILTSPYWWEEDEVRVNEWIGGQHGQHTTDALRSLLAELGIALVAEQPEVPWILRYNNRAFMSFITDVILCRVKE
jgi:SAM-dependent methyltransferase